MSKVCVSCTEVCVCVQYSAVVVLETCLHKCVTEVCGCYRGECLLHGVCVFV